MQAMSDVMKGQNLHDIAIQELGTADAAFDMAIINDISVTDLLNPEEGVIIPDNSIRDPKTANFYSTKGLNPATENRGILGSAIGINFWSIEEDFRVS